MIALYTDTLRALVAPRRALPIAVVVLTMLYAQFRVGMTGTEPSGLLALVPALAMASFFVLCAPFAWRALMPADAPPRPWAVLAYAALCTAPSLVGWLAGATVGLGYTFVTYRYHLPVTAALFAAGGWGLARDIDLERGMHSARARAERLAREAEHAQLLAMRAHLDPHFLFNTLNAIAEYTREDPETAEQAILRLSDLLREVLGGIRAATWPLTRELGLARDLLELHRLRDPTWFEALWQVAEVELAVPPLLLLPLVENAVKHGPAKGHRGQITVSVTRVAQRVVITVDSPGPWQGPRDGGEGLATVKRRLELAYGGQAELQAGSHGQGTRVSVHLPAASPPVAS